MAHICKGLTRNLEVVPDIVGIEVHVLFLVHSRIITYPEIKVNRYLKNC
jgi:hypothetical protein